MVGAWEGSGFVDFQDLCVSLVPGGAAVVCLSSVVCCLDWCVRVWQFADARDQIEKNDSELRQYRDIVVADDA